MRLITFSGVDGSGKSTQLSLLREHLERQGKKVAYFHSIEFSLANRFARIFLGKREFQGGSERAVTEASLASVILREIFLFFDLVRFFFFRRRLANEGYDYLLSDRFFFDSLVNFSYLSASPLIRWKSRCLESLLPAVDIPFFVDTQPEAIMSRERAPEQGLQYLQRKRELFLGKISSWKMTAIDGNHPKEDVFDSILAVLHERLSNTL